MTIKYPLSVDGVKMFEDDTLHDIMNAIHKGNADDYDIFVTIGNREIRIPINAETFDELTTLLKCALEV